MHRAISVALLVLVSSPAVARSIDKCVTRKRFAEVEKLVHEIETLHIPYRVDNQTVCVDEENGDRFYAVVSRLFSRSTKTEYLEIPPTPSGVPANSVNFYDPTDQAELEVLLRRKGIWFTKDESGTMWYEVTNEKEVREVVFGIIDRGNGRKRSNPTVERDARKSGARPSP